MKKILFTLLFCSLLSSAQAARSVLSFQFPNAAVQQEILDLISTNTPAPESVSMLHPFVGSLSFDTMRINEQKLLTVNGGNFDPNTVFEFDTGITINEIDIVSSSTAILSVESVAAATTGNLTVKNGSSLHFGGAFSVEIVDQIILIPGGGGSNPSWGNVEAMIGNVGSIVPSTPTSSWQKGASFGTVPANTDFKLSFQPKYMNGQSSGGYAMFGVDQSDPDRHYSTIDYAIYMRNGSELRVYENGVDRGSLGSFEMTDTLAVVRSGTIISYLKNDEVFYTSSIASSESLVFDSSMYRYLGAQNIQIVLD